MPMNNRPVTRKDLQQYTAQMKPMPKITGTASTRENFATSSRRAGSMTSSGLPRTTPGITGKNTSRVSKVYRQMGSM